MIYFITKLDRRMNGYGNFSHRLDFVGSRYDALKKLQEIRSWLWENFGPGAEFYVTRDLGSNWGWDTDREYRRLYVTEEILSLLRLKWY